MADDNENRQTYTLGAFDLKTAEKYIRFLDRRIRFGGHTGLPKEMRNKEPNHSLDFSLGIYETVDVYTTPTNECPIGTIVNFYKNDTINTEGTTYVYPCVDTTIPMGCMITNASPEVVGVCLVHGVIEVPLIYDSDETPPIKRDFVQYDIETSSFEFAESGYPVFNVYQDADGDWIAIILFGNTSADWQYDGPFATTIAGVTGSTMYVNVAEGDFIQENERFNFNDADLMTNIPLCTGETLWLNTYLNGTAWSYSLEARNTPPTQNQGGSLWYRIAENTGDGLVQLQYGDLFNDIQHLEVDHIDISGHTAFIRISGYSSTTFTDKLLLRGIGCTFNTLGQNDLSIIVEGSTSGGINQNLYSSMKVISGTTNSSPAICLSDSTEYINVVGENNIYTRLGVGGEIIIGSTYSQVYQDLTSSVTGGTAVVGITGSNSKVNLEGMGNVYLTEIRASATPSEITSWGTRSDGSLKNAGWRGIIPLKIFNKDVEDDYVMTEVSISSEISGVETEYPLIVPDTTDEELSIIASCALGEISAQDLPYSLIDKALEWAEYRLGQSKSPFYNGDASDESIRNIPDADSIIVYGVVPSLVTSVSDNIATVNLVGSTSYVRLIGGEDVLVEEGDEGEIIIGSTVSNTGSFSVRSWDEIEEDIVVHKFEIYDSSNRDSDYGKAGWVHIGSERYSLLSYMDSFTDGDVVYLVGTFDTSNYLSLQFTKIRTFFPTINSNQFCVRICYAENGRMHRTQFGDIVQPARLVGDGTTTQIIGNTISCIGGGGGSTYQDLDYTVSGNTANVKLTHSNVYMPIVGGTNTYIRQSIYGEIVIGSTQNLNYSVSSNTASIGLRGSTSSVKIKGNGVNITDSTDGIILDSSVTYNVAGGQLYLGLNGLNAIVIKGKTTTDSMVTIEEDDSEIVIGATVTGGGGGGSGENIQFYWFPRYTSGSTADRIITVTGDSNKAYCISSEYNSSDSFVFSNASLRTLYDGLDFSRISGGDVILELPSASTISNSLCIKVYMFRTILDYFTRLVVVAPDMIPIIDNNQGYSDYTSNAEQLQYQGCCIFMLQQDCEVISGGTTYTKCWRVMHFME